MFSSKTSDVVNLLAETMLRMEKLMGAEPHVVFITLCLEVGKTSGDEKLLRRYVHLMYYAPASYVLVGAQASDTSCIPNHHEWQYRAHHDSCWRYDGTDSVLWEEYLSMCKEVDSNVAPVKLHTSANIHSTQFRKVTSVVETGKNGLIRLEF